MSVVAQGETGFQKDLNYFLPFLKNVLRGVTPYNYVIDVLQMFWSFTLFQYSLDQPVANGGTVFPPLGQSIPGVLDAPPGESKLWPSLC